MMKKVVTLSLATLAMLAPALALAEEAPKVSAGEFYANNTWMMLCTALVFIMHLGFASIESGLTRSKNTVNILYKNTVIVLIGLISYYLIGFGLMYPGDGWQMGKYLGFAGALIQSPEAADQTIGYASGHYTYYTDFLFQGMFAATAATIVSGAVAERIKFPSFIVFSVFFVTCVYTIGGSWKWGGGWLNDAGFYDFAGSTLVHSVGGWGALAGAMLLGPRLGKYGKKGEITPIPGSNMPLATAGCFLLWLGWFGFNGGSVLSADPDATSRVLVTTCLAAAAGGLGSMLAYMFVSKKPDLSMTLNGILAGLVGITAGADVITPNMSVVVGFIAGGLVIGSVVLMDKAKIDDPVGAVSVHLVCGIWGTLAVGLFSTNPEHTLAIQLMGIAAYAAFAGGAAFLLFYAIKATMGLRVSAEEEIDGLDDGEHSMHAYDMGLSSLSAAAPISMKEASGATPAEVPAE
ncbi:MAG TPA: ammonium transporter [Polyangiaceae bacterium]